MSKDFDDYPGEAQPVVIVASKKQRKQLLRRADKDSPISNCAGVLTFIIMAIVLIKSLL